MVCNLAHWQIDTAPSSRPQGGKRGGQCKLSVEDQLLLVLLEYGREYRTQFTSPLAEISVSLLYADWLAKVETLLMRLASSAYRQKGDQNAYAWEVVVDVTEGAIERQKNSDLTTVARKAAHPESASSGQ